MTIKTAPVEMTADEVSLLLELMRAKGVGYPADKVHTAAAVLDKLDRAALVVTAPEYPASPA